MGLKHQNITRSYRSIAFLASCLMVSSGALAAEPGITDNEILLGMSNPYSGPNASYGVIGSAIKACFDYYNAEEDGIQMGDGHRRKVALKVYDDAMEPARALQNARRLVSQDKVFATVGNTGTGANLAVRKFYNQNKVPHLFIGSGGPMFGAKEEVESYPWSMLAWPAYNTEAAIYANYIKENYPDAKIALLNDDSGGPFFADAFVQTAKDLGLNLVVHEEHTYSESTINAKISRLAESGADLFMDATTPKFVVQAIRQIDALDWDPVHIVWGVGSSIGGVLEPAGTDLSKGILTGIWLKDYTNPAVKDHDDVKLFGEKLVEYDSDLNPADQNAAAGWYACHGIKDAFEKMEEPTRSELMNVMRNLESVSLPLLLDGITVTTSGSDDGYPIEAIQIVEFDGEKYVTVGDVISYEGKTPKYVPRK